MAARLVGLWVRIPPRAWMFVLCVVSKDKNAKCRIVKTKTQVQIKYRVQENTKNPGGVRIRLQFRPNLWLSQPLFHMSCYFTFYLYNFVSFCFPFYCIFICSGRSVRLTTDLHLVPRLRLSGAVPLLPLYGSMSCTLTTSPLFEFSFN